MKKLIIAFFILFSTTSFSQPKKIGSGGTSSVSATDYQYVNAEDNGVATGNTAAANTTAINALFITAKAFHKGVKIGGGTFLFNQINWDVEVPFIGAGRENTILKSASAVPLLHYGNTVDVPNPAGVISDMRLNGNSSGTIGIEIQGLAGFIFQRLWIENFTQKGIVAYGMLLGEIKNTEITNCPIGIWGDRSTQSSIGLMQPNAVYLTDVKVQFASTYAVQWARGAQLVMDKCNFENNGTNGNANTGCVYASSMCPSDEGNAIVIRDSWAEANKGGFIVRIDNPSGNAQSVISNLITPINVATSAIVVNGTGGFTNNVLMIGGKVRSATTDLVANGANASIDVLKVTYTTTSGTITVH